MMILLPLALAEQLGLFGGGPRETPRWWRTAEQTGMFGAPAPTTRPAKTIRAVQVQPGHRADGTPIRGHVRLQEVNVEPQLEPQPAEAPNLFTWMHGIPDTTLVRRVFRGDLLWDTVNPVDVAELLRRMRETARKGHPHGERGSKILARQIGQLEAWQQARQAETEAEIEAVRAAAAQVDPDAALLDLVRSLGWDGNLRTLTPPTDPLPPAQARTLRDQCRERGEAYVADGEAGINTPRNANTARRQSQAAASFEAADAKARMGKAMLNLADAIDAGYQPTRFDRLMLQRPYRDATRQAEWRANPDEDWKRSHGKLTYLDLGKAWDLADQATLRAQLEWMDAAIARIAALPADRQDDTEAIRPLLASPPKGGWSWTVNLWQPNLLPYLRDLSASMRSSLAGWEEERRTDPHGQLKQLLYDRHAQPGGRSSAIYVPNTPAMLAAAELLEADPETARPGWRGKLTTEIKRAQDLGWINDDDYAAVAELRATWLARFGSKATAKPWEVKPPDRSKARRPLAERLKAAEQEERRRFIPYDLQHIAGFFETPPPVVEEMIEWARIEPGMTVLEPSAGRGGIADRLPGDVQITVAEKDARLREVLKVKGYAPIGDQHEVAGRYDRIVMNPPFEGGQDMAQVMHAYENLLKPGGVLVAITSPAWRDQDNTRTRAFRQRLDRDMVGVKTLESGTFSRSGTGVTSVMFKLEKPK